MWILLCVLSLLSCPKSGPTDVLCPRPKQTASWKASPIVRICSKSVKDWRRVEVALNFWRSLGHEFGVVKYGDTTPWCLGHEMIFSIVIKEESFYDPRTFGETITKTMGDSVIGSVVTIRKDHLLQPHILEHEIGHALGYKHIQCPGHTMHNYTNSIGNHTKGLQNEPTQPINFLLADRQKKKKSQVVQCTIEG